MNILVITPPPVEPVTLSEVYAHLRLDPDGSPPEHPHDAMLRAHIQTAREQAEKDTRRAFVEQRLRLSTAGFPRCRKVDLLRPPVRSVQSVRYYDTANTLQTVDAASYFLTEDVVPQLQFLDSFAPPATYPSRGDALRIEYTAGYEPEGSPAEDYVANIPQAIKQAILLGVELLYGELSPDRRADLQRSREALLWLHKIALVK